MSHETHDRRLDSEIYKEMRATDPGEPRYQTLLKIVIDRMTANTEKLRQQGKLI